MNKLVAVVALVVAFAGGCAPETSNCAMTVSGSSDTLQRAAQMMRECEQREAQARAAALAAEQQRIVAANATATALAMPTYTPTATPTMTPAPEPTSTPMPEPTMTATPSPTETSVPEPTQTSTPVPEQVATGINWTGLIAVAVGLFIIVAGVGLLGRWIWRRLLNNGNG